MFEPKQFNNFNGYVAIAPNVAPIAQIIGHNAAALWIGTGGDVQVTDKAGNLTTFKNVPSGTMLPVLAVTLNAAGTTASNIVALFRV